MSRSSQVNFMLLNKTNTVDYAMDIHKSLHHTEDVPQGAQIKGVVVPVPESEISGTGTPGPDFWSSEPPQGSDKASDDVIDLPTAMKTSAQLNLSNPVLEKERYVDYLSIPLESKLQEPNRNPPLPPFQSLMEFEKVEHELGDEFSAHAAEVARTLDAVDEASSYGVNEDGSKWWKESGIKQRPDGVICKWTMTRGVSADQVTEWQDKYWEAADEFGHKELGSEKLGRDATGNVWREFWTKSMWQRAYLRWNRKLEDIEHLKSLQDELLDAASLYWDVVWNRARGDDVVEKLQGMDIE